MASPTDRVLVTGASGFTGSRLLRALVERGVEARGLSRRPRGTSEIEGDLSNAASLARVMAEARPRVIVHLAAVTFVGHADQGEIYETNVAGTARLLQAAQSAAVKPDLVLLASSATVYAPAGDEPIPEDHPLEPLSHYGLSKVFCERLTALYPDLPVRVVRPFNYTGPGQPEKFLVPKIVDHFARGTGVVELGNLDLYRDLSAVDDTVEAYLRLIDGSGAGAALNICSGEALHLASVVDLLREISGREMQVRVNPDFVRAGEPRAIVGSRERLDAEIGVWPRRAWPDLLTEMYETRVRSLQRATVG